MFGVTITYNSRRDSIVLSETMRLRSEGIVRAIRLRSSFVLLRGMPF